MKIILLVLSVTCWGISKGSPLALDSSLLENAKNQQNVKDPLNFVPNDESKSLGPHTKDLNEQPNIKENQKVNSDNGIKHNFMTTEVTETKTPTTAPQPTTATAQPTTTTTTSTTPKPITEEPNSPEEERENIHINDHHILGPFAGELINNIRNSKGKQDVNQTNKIIFNFGRQ